MPTIFSIAGVPINLNSDGSADWLAGMMIDADGAPKSYHPTSSRGLDAHSSAGYPKGGWRNILVSLDDGPPVVQGRGDPAPGFYISKTSYVHRGFKVTDPHRYVDASEVPFVVVPPQVRLRLKGIVLGCRALITYRGRVIEAVVADVGPRTKIGEASIKAAELLGINSNPRTGGLVSRSVTYQIFPGVPARVNGFTYELQPA